MKSLTTLLVLLLFYGCLKPSKPENEEKPVAKETREESVEHGKDTVSLDEEAQRSAGLEVEAAKMVRVANTILVTGAVKPNETRVAHLKTVSRGRVTKLNVRAGDRITGGQSLLVYENVEAGELAGEYRSALANRNKATAEADVAKKALDRGESLVAAGAISRAEVERRSAEYKSAQASIEVAQADMDRVSEKLRRFGVTPSDLTKFISSPSTVDALTSIVFRAPFDGVITATNVAEGELIDTSDDVFTLSDLSTVWVLGDLYERDLGQIHIGQQADILIDAYPNDIFHGRVTHVSDAIDPQTRTAKVRCEVSNARDRLKLDMFAHIRLQSSGTRIALTVPDSAIQVIDEKNFVFVRKDDATFTRREVKLGTKNGTAIEIVKGLNEGEVVATKGSFSLKSALLKDRIGGEEQ